MQDERAAAEAIRKPAVDGREQKLHQRPGGAEQPVDFGRAGGVAGEKIDHQLGQHRNDDTERQHVEQHGDEEEDEGGTRCRRGRLRFDLEIDPRDQLAAIVVLREAE